MDQPQDPSMQQAAPAATPDPSATPDDGSYTICIKVDLNQGGKGALSVGVESAAEDAAEGGEAAEGPGDDESEDYTPAQSIKQALTMALDIYNSQGKASPGDAMGKRLGSAGFAAGYEED